jgi:hypothetical protein
MPVRRKNKQQLRKMFRRMDETSGFSTPVYEHGEIRWARQTPFIQVLVVLDVNNNRGVKP